MKTISTKAVIGPDRVLTLQLPTDVTPGEHEVVVVLNGVAAEQPPLLSGPYPFGPVDPSCTFSREDLYEDVDR